MREFELVIDEALGKGLSPTTNPPPNSQWLRECLGFKCLDGGLEDYVELANPLPIAFNIDYVWPFPQVIVGERYTILVIRDTVTGYDSVYSVDATHTTVSLLFEIQSVVHSASLLEVADFGEYIFMTNGAAMVYWDAESSVWQRIAESDTIPSIRTVTNFKGQAVGGCVLSDWYDCDETFYVWSEIGSINFTPGKDNEAGYRRCPYGGEVYHTRRVGDAVIGFSSEGITLLFPSSSATPEYGTGATFGFKELDGVGLINRGAVNGTLRRQIYVGEDYILREVTSEGVKELGYQYYMERLAGEDIIVSYDPSEKDFYIGNSTKTYLLSSDGLTEITQHPSTVWRLDGQTHMLPVTVDSDDPYLCSLPFNMSYGGEKTVFSIETDAFGIVGAEASVDWSKDLETWNANSYVSINNEGIAAIIISGNSFMFKLRFDSLNEGAKISYIKARYKMTDMRGIRGVYAPPPRGQ